MIGNKQNENEIHDEGIFTLLHYVEELGLAVHPSIAGSKIPVGKWKNEYSKDSWQILEWIKKYNTYVFGVTLCECNEYYVVVDIDIRSDFNGFDSFKKIPNYCHDDLKETFAVTTPSGGRHYWFKSDKEVNGAIGVVKGVDILGFKNRVIAPGSKLKTGEAYEVIQDKCVQDLPVWIEDFLECRKLSVIKSNSNTNHVLRSTRELGELLASIDPNINYQDWRDVCFAALSEFGKTEEVIDILNTWSSDGDSYDEGSFMKLINSYRSDRSKHKIGTLVMMTNRNLAVSITNTHEADNSYKFTEAEIVLCNEASQITLDLIKNYGGKLTNDHEKDIKMICSTLVEGIFSEMPSKKAIGLYTGGGKTSCIKGVVKAVEHTERSLLIAVGTVKGQKELRDDLVSMGISEDKMNIFHESRNREHEDIKSIPRDQVQNIQFLIVTHSRVKSPSFEEQDFFQFKGVKRDLCIWDEALISSIGNALDLKQLMPQINGWQNHIRNGPLYESKSRSSVISLDIGIRKKLHRFLIACKKTIHDGLENNNVVIEVPELPVQPYHANKSIQCYDDSQDDLQMFVSWCAGSNRVVRIIETNQGNALVNISRTTPEFLDNVVVLDASAEINELMKLDASIEIYPFSSVKDFKNVTLNIVNERASRTQFRKIEHVTRVVKMVKEYICDKRIDEDILIYGLKEKGFQYQDNLKHALSKVIPEERIYFVTHGNERGINEFRDIKHIVIIGVPYLSERVLQAQIIGQMDDIYFNVKPELANKISHSCIADHFYQAIGRGNCRNIENGQAGEMTILMFLPQRDWRVIEYLSKVMKNLTVVEWRSQYQTENSRDDMEKWLRLAFKYLNQDKPEDFTSGKLKSVIGFKLDANSKGWRRFIKLFEQKVREHYIKDGSTFRRQ